MQILPGVYLINGSPYGRHQNGYLVHRDGTTILIDSGDLDDAETLPEVERYAARWGFQLEQASHLFITHAHFDHASHPDFDRAKYIHSLSHLLKLPLCDHLLRGMGRSPSAAASACWK